MTSSARYVGITLTPIGKAQGRSLWIHLIFTIPPSPLQIRKWDCIAQRFQFWYEDSDGDNITLGSCAELVSAVHELEREPRHVIGFQFKRAGMEDEELLFALMDELERMKIRYHVLGTDWRRGTGRGESIYVDRRTRMVVPGVEALGNLVMKEKEKPEEEPEPAAFMDTVSSTSNRQLESDEKVAVGENVTIGENVHVGEEMELDETVPEHDDLAPTPDSLSPIPSPRLEPFANNDTPLIDLPPFTTFTHIHNQQPDQSTMAPSPPDSPPSESLFPDVPFPGAFPADPSNPFASSPLPNQHLQALQTRISIALRAAIDSLAQLGHMTLTTAQNTGLPLQSPHTTYPQAHQSLHATTLAAHSTLHTHLTTARTTLESSLDSARTTLSSARTNLESSLDTARAGLESSLETARRNLDSGVGVARDGVVSATRQVEQVIRRAAQTVQEGNVVSPATAERLVAELRVAGERVERAVEEMTLRLQRRIDARSTDLPRDERQEEEEDLYRVPPTGEANRSNGGEEGHGERVDQDRVGTGSLPGAFPVEKSKEEECTDQLIEMGFFGETERDSAMAVSVAANGDIESALAILSGE